MKASQFLLSTLRETPSDADIVSSQLMIKADSSKNLPRGFMFGCPWGFVSCAKWNKLCVKR